ncbi:chemotaxis-specific protein-glutamate methyltransferase CheB [Planctomicrobium sp. SH668]|uniref:chemotaxis-specific protein-glutamate methyltransferase CheB n=1 Tax=Planctomicrobium sp. SH668 TaxID=3448126 RepID=UPI003F5C3D75
MIRLLIVEDSITQREILRQLIEASGQISVVAEARNGREAVAAVHKFRPDVVLMDIHMPDMDGVAATREIMRNVPVPIVIASAALKRQEVDLGLEALKAGAVSVIEKPQGAVLLHLNKIAPQLCQELIGASKAKVTGRKLAVSRSQRQTGLLAAGRKFDLVGICASTGGPPVLLQILSQLPNPIPVPVLIVQHIAASFVEGFRRWLEDLSHQQVRIATHGQVIEPGFWMSGGNGHLCVNGRGRFDLKAPGPKEIHCPSGNALFASLAEHYRERAIGVVLTGMGDDGADGLKLLRDAGGQTIAQNEETSVIFGMPKVALDRGAAEVDLAPHAIVQLIANAVGRKDSNRTS